MCCPVSHGIKTLKWQRRGQKKRKVRIRGGCWPAEGHPNHWKDRQFSTVCAEIGCSSGGQKSQFSRRGGETEDRGQRSGQRSEVTRRAEEARRERPSTRRSIDQKQDEPENSRALAVPMDRYFAPRVITPTQSVHRSAMLSGQDNCCRRNLSAMDKNRPQPGQLRWERVHKSYC